MMVDVKERGEEAVVTADRKSKSTTAPGFPAKAEGEKGGWEGNERRRMG